ncbi:MAG TPA: FtsX-like permease family protein [Patescibacteria group bacterium]|nr:FtsX-like permease family protein [Patescibacteria group bacterium]
MNDFKTAFFIAYKSILKGSRSMLGLLIFILFLSFFNMMFISGVLNGISYSEVEALKSFMSSDLVINPQELPVHKQYILNQNEVRAEIASIPGVVATTRHYLLAGSLVFDKDKNGQYKSVSGTIIGFDPSDENKVLTFNKLLMAGQFLSDTDTDQIVISGALAGGYGEVAPNDLGGAKVGDKIRITYSNGIMRTYTVKGIYNDVMGIYETFISAKEAESVLSVYNSANQILVKTDDNSNTIDSYETKIKAMEPNLKVQNYNDIIASFASFLQALDLISFVVGVISVIVATITIFVLIYVNALNKKRQIGILKAIGIKQSIIINAYILQSLFYTFCGVSLGVVMVFLVLQPLLISHPIPLIQGLMNLILIYSPTGIILSILSFIIAGYLAGRTPAWLVARQDILKAIWG